MNPEATTLKKQGFLKLEKIFDEREIQELCHETKAIFDAAPKLPYAEKDKHEYSRRPPAFKSRDHEVLTYLRGRSKKLDALMEKLVTSKSFGDALHPLIGERYTMWTVDMRRSTTNDIGLGLHQDADGEVGITILLDDNDEWSSATVFLPGSHWIPVRLKETALNYMNTTWLKWILKPVVGKAGDVFLFFHSTWHGRYPNTSGRIRSILLISVFPEGYPVEPQPMNHEDFAALPHRLKALMTPPPKEALCGAKDYDRAIDRITFHKQGLARSAWKIALSVPARLRSLWLTIRGVKRAQWAK